MGMVPTVNRFVDDDNEQLHLSSRDRKIADGRMVGWVDGIDAVKQAVWKRLNTEAEVYDIYSSEYGLKTVDLVGKETGFAISRLKRRIESTLLCDDRISKVYNFKERVNKKKIVTISFDVDSIFGTCGMEVEVQI